MNSAFLKSFQTLSKIYSDKAYSTIALNKTLLFCSAKDRALITKIVYGVLDNDIRLSYQISKYVRKMPKDDVLLYLKMGVFCLTDLSIPKYAVVNDIAELSKLSGDKHIVGFVNATLKNIANSIADFNDYPDDEVMRLSVENSYPEWALRKLIKDYGLDIAKKIVCAPIEERTTIRFTCGFDKFCDLNSDKALTPTMFGDACYVDGNLPQADKTFTVQSLSSMAISRICAEKVIDSFLDCCSAPGGKAIYVKQLRPETKVTACDVHSHRVEFINANAKRMDVDIEAYCKDMTVRFEPFEKSFDVVLCDVPCSGFGVLNNRPDIKLFRESKDISELMKLQYAILSNCCDYVKVGGYLVYSTCTVFDNENGQNIRRFLKEHTNFEYGIINLPEFPSVDGKAFYQFLPHKDGVQGFYVAVLKRTE